MTDRVEELLADARRHADEAKRHSDLAVKYAKRATWWAIAAGALALLAVGLRIYVWLGDKK
jgi:hypothetical protein